VRAAAAIQLFALLACTMGLIALGGCASVPVSSSPVPGAGEAGDSPQTVRTLQADQRFTDVPLSSLAQRLHERRPTEPISILALSGGGADGAFGAGALVGLAHSGTLPRFAVVTGVSAGALIAPYAFLGPDWDDQLTDAYTSGRADHLLQPRALGALFGSSVYSGSPLMELVDHYLSDALIKAVAREAAAGRLLLVATTNVDTGETVVWDLGSIALNGGAEAKAEFRDVLVASASVPGMFPPVIMRVPEHGASYEEAHVDGTATVPFLAPAAFTSRPATAVYVLVDGRLSEQPRSVPLRFRSIMSRSISTGLTHMVRTQLELTAATTQLNGAGLEYSAIPVAYPDLAAFDFNPSGMRSLFSYGYQCARAGRLWIRQHALGDDGNRDDPVANQGVRCPADDEFIVRFAER
jgi:predicted acylesterase/phospholipase RssA